MSININMRQANIFCFGSRTKRRTDPYGNWPSGKWASGNWPNTQKGTDGDKDIYFLKRMLSRDQQAGQDNGYPRSIVEQSLSYSDSLREARMKAKNTTLELKKLYYNFKSISAEILRSKTSVNARQVVGKARREVLRLKRLRQSGGYDNEELNCAITHAQAMERVAKKKARHLEEEELIKVAGGPCAGGLEERLEEGKQEKDPADESAEENGSDIREPYSETASLEDLSREAEEWMRQSQQAMEEMMALLREKTSASMEDMLSGMMEEMLGSMNEMLKESGLSDLAESMSMTVERQMDPADYKMLKTKHRLEEMRAIAEADAEYLKVVFKMLEESKGSAFEKAFGNMSGQASFGGSIPTGGAVLDMAGGGVVAKAVPVQAIVDVASAPDAAMPSVAGAIGGSVDVSI